jgi:hypothetical protein
MVHGMFACAGAVRIDHILGLFRLWWIPEGQPASNGTYVYYDHNTCWAFSQSKQTVPVVVVVGEDLGVVPAYVQQSLSDMPSLGCAVEWFEQMDGVFRRRRIGARMRWPRWTRTTCRRLPAISSTSMSRARAARSARRGFGRGIRAQRARRASGHAADARRQRLSRCQCAERRIRQEKEIVEALYRALNSSPCKLKAASIVDAVGEAARRTSRAPTTSIRTGVCRWPTGKATWCRSSSCSTTRSAAAHRQDHAADGRSSTLLRKRRYRGCHSRRFAVCERGAGEVPSRVANVKPRRYTSRIVVFPYGVLQSAFPLAIEDFQGAHG